MFFDPNMGRQSRNSRNSANSVGKSRISKQLLAEANQKYQEELIALRAEEQNGGTMYTSGVFKKQNFEYADASIAKHRSEYNNKSIKAFSALNSKQNEGKDRFDRNGTLIQKGGNREHQVTFADNVDPDKPVAAVKLVESYKRFNAESPTRCCCTTF